jgi:hypothetical protein
VTVLHAFSNKARLKIWADEHETVVDPDSGRCLVRGTYCVAKVFVLREDAQKLAGQSFTGLVLHGRLPEGQVEYLRGLIRWPT